MDEAMQQSGPIVVRAGPAGATAAAAAAGDAPSSPGDQGGGGAGGGLVFEGTAETTNSPAARVPGLQLLNGIGGAGGSVSGSGDDRSSSPGGLLAR